MRPASAPGFSHPRLRREHPEWADYLEEMKQRYNVRETQYIDYGALKYYGAAELSGGELIATEESFALEAPGLEIAPSDSVICGYRCKVATTVINSNTINYWFTDEAGVEGTVQPAASGGARKAQPTEQPSARRGCGPWLFEPGRCLDTKIPGTCEVSGIGSLCCAGRQNVTPALICKAPIVMLTPESERHCAL